MKIVKKTTKPYRILKRLPYYSFWIIMSFALFFSAWILWLRINSGLEIATPKFLLFDFFLVAGGFIAARYLKRHPAKFFQSPKFRRLILIGAIVLGIVCRLLFLSFADEFQPNGKGTDTGVHYYAAQEILSTGQIQTESTGRYEAYHSQLTSYTMLTAVFMKIFGVNYFAVLLPNIIFDLAGALALYLLLRRWQNERAATLGVIFWLLNPLGIVFCAEALALTAVNAFMVWVLYVIYLAHDANKQQNYRLMLGLFIIGGLLSAVGNALRPVFSVIFIALTVFVLVQILQSSQCQSALWLFGGLFAFALVFIGCGALIERSYLLVNPYYHKEDLGHGALGWNLFVGANYDTAGRWSFEDWELMPPRLYDSDMTPAAINHDFTSMALARYRAMSPQQLVVHLINKTQILFCRNDITIVRNLEEQFTSVDGTERWYWILNNSSLIIITIFAALTFTFFCFIFQRHKSRPDYFTFFLALCFCGLLASSLLVEVMSRYVSIFIVPFVIFSTSATDQLLRRYFSDSKSAATTTVDLPKSTSA